jgi:radical SAM protein with 4Fe4S-binding SPASM domain
MPKITILNQKFTLGQAGRLSKPLLTACLPPRRLANLLAAKFARRDSAAAMPPVLMVEASSLCDMACAMCPVILDKSRRAKGNMPLKGFLKLLQETGATTAAICFWNFGEPLLNPDLAAMISAAKKRGIFTAVSSNLLSLDSAQKQQGLIESGLDYLIVSFDGATAETFEKFRGKGNFPIVLNNLKAFLALKKRLRRKLPFINLQFVLMRDNEAEIPLIRRMAAELGVDKLSLKKFTYIGETSADFLPRNPSYILKKQVQEARMRGCARPWESAVISWDGAVLPCCGDLQFSLSMGNVFQEGLKSVWNNEKYRQFRRQVIEGINNIPVCKTCPSTDFTTEMFVE